MKVVSISPPVQAHIECDGYVPLVIRFEGNAPWPPKYWRTGDFRHSLVEMAVDPSTGTVCKIVVTAIHDVCTGDGKLDRHLGWGRRSGVPTTSLTIWAGNQSRVDVEGNVRGSLDGRTFTILFWDGYDGFEIVNCGRINFLVDARNELAGFQVLDLTELELENLRFAIGSRGCDAKSDVAT